MTKQYFVVISPTTMNLFLLLTQRQITDMHNYSFYFITFLPYTLPPNNHPNPLAPALLYHVSNTIPNNYHQPMPTLETIRPTTDRQSPHQEQQAQNGLPNPTYPSDQVAQPFQQQNFERHSLVVDQNVYKYPKKNAQSNLTNQIFSYISIAGKSSNILIKLLDGNQEKVRVFYQLMKQVKRHNKKYINRAYIRDLMLIKRSHIIGGILQKMKIESLLTIDELRTTIRTLVLHYLTHTCTLTLLTSSKLDRYSIPEHLERRRHVLQYLKHSLRHSQQ